MAITLIAAACGSFDERVLGFLLSTEHDPLGAHGLRPRIQAGMDRPLDQKNPPQRNPAIGKTLLGHVNCGAYVLVAFYVYRARQDAKM
jgi:hypothetical protein